MREKLDRGGEGGREREEGVERTVIRSEEEATQLVRLCSLMSPPLVTVTVIFIFHNDGVQQQLPFKKLSRIDLSFPC